MSGWGQVIRQAVDGATDSARSQASAMMSSVGNAAAAVRERAAAMANTVQEGAVAVGEGAYNAGSFVARAGVETAGAAASAAGNVISAPYRLARQALSPTRTPREKLVEPCVNSWEAKRQRLEERNARAAAGKQSPDPGKRAAAARLLRNTESVELAKLSEDTYAQYPQSDKLQPKEGHQPPLGWTPLSNAELQAAGIDPDLLADSQAVIYRSSASWPGGQKTVVAFRGTADLQDVVVDHDQAMGLATTQYQGAANLGRMIAKSSLGNNVVVTGHSLGGGKAQTAGAFGGLKGTMFNSAGLNPASVEGRMPAADQFQQYRTPGDPLTGMQNSPALQTAVAALAGILATPLGAGMKAGDYLQKLAGATGLSPEYADYADKAFKVLPRALKNVVSDGNLLPPAVGPVTVVPSIGEDGQPLNMLNPNQHSITLLVNGIEQEKAEDMATLTS